MHDDRKSKGIQPDSSNDESVELIIRQQPVHSRMCGIGERVDRRPIDPPPVVQIKLNTDDSAERLSIMSSYLFLIAVLVPTDGRDNPEHLNILLHSKLTVGRTVSSLYTLRDLDGTEAAFFVFSDISVRAEGNYRLRMCLFDIRDQTVNYKQSVLTDPFTVYSAKTFPGMYRSCPLVQNFAKQGLKIRIRKESGPRPSRYAHSNRKDIRKATDSPIDIPNKRNKTDSPEIYETKQEEDEDMVGSNSSSGSCSRNNPNNISSTDFTINSKRRLSLSYLLDQDDNIPHQANDEDGLRLAPINTTTVVANTNNNTLTPTSNTNTATFTHFNNNNNTAALLYPAPYHQQDPHKPDLPPIHQQLQYISKRS